MPDLDAIRPLLDQRHLAIAGELEAFARAEIRPLPEPPNDGMRGSW